MSRCLGRTCAGVLLLVVTGCTLDAFLSPQIMVYGPKQVVPGSVGEVSRRLEDGLSEAGVFLRKSRVGSDYRIVSQWKKRTVFCLHLSEKKIGGSVNTLVRMQWDQGGDDELWQLILTILNASAGSGSEGKSSAAREK